MANRWSPSVVAEAPPTAPVSMLGRAIGTGLSVYKDRRDTRLEEERRKQALAISEQRRKEDLTYRDLQDTRSAAKDALQLKIAAADRARQMAENNWSTEMPEEETAEAPEEQPHMITPPGSGQAPVRAGGPKLAGNSGPGGAVSEAQPQWYMQGKNDVEREAKRLYPGSGTQRWTDPVTGQTSYRPVRQLYIKDQMAKLDERLKAEQTRIGNREWDEHMESVRQGNRLAVRAAPSGASGGDGDAVDPSVKRYNQTLSQINTQIDNAARNINAFGNLARNAEDAGDLPGMQAAQARVAESGKALAAAEERYNKLMEMGPDGFARSQVTAKITAGKVAAGIANPDGTPIPVMPGSPTPSSPRATNATGSFLGGLGIPGFGGASRPTPPPAIAAPTAPAAPAAPSATSDEVMQAAQEILNDPESTPEERAAAQAALSKIGPRRTTGLGRSM